MANPQTPTADSGLVLAIPITITPMIASEFVQGSAVVRATVAGLNALIVEASFSWDGIDFAVWPQTVFGGSDGNGLPSGFKGDLPLPAERPPWIRLRAQSAVGTTDARLQIYEFSTFRPNARGQFAPVTQ